MAIKQPLVGKRLSNGRGYKAREGEGARENSRNRSPPPLGYRREAEQSGEKKRIFGEEKSDSGRRKRKESK